MKNIIIGPLLALYEARIEHEAECIKNAKLFDEKDNEYCYVHAEIDEVWNLPNGVIYKLKPGTHMAYDGSECYGVIIQNGYRKIKDIHYPLVLDGKSRPFEYFSDIESAMMGYVVWSNKSSIEMLKGWIEELENEA